MSQPEPNVKGMSDVTIARNGHIEDLERQLAKAREDATKWEKLYDEISDGIEFEVMRDNYGPTETHAQAIARIVAERNTERALADRLAYNLGVLLDGYDDAKEIAPITNEDAHTATRAIEAWKEARKQP